MSTNNKIKKTKIELTSGRCIGLGTMPNETNHILLQKLLVIQSPAFGKTFSKLKKMLFSLHFFFELVLGLHINPDNKYNTNK